MADSRILIVDDDKELLQLLELRLKKEGFVVYAMDQGQHILEKAKKFKPQLILMDILLEDMDGAEVVKLLQDDEATAAIPIIFLSGIVTKEKETQEEIKVGNRLYPAIPKPFTAERLLDVMKDQLRS